MHTVRQAQADRAHCPHMAIREDVRKNPCGYSVRTPTRENREGPTGCRRRRRWHSRSRSPRIGSGLGAGFDEWSISTWKRCEKLASLCSGREFTCDNCSLATEGDRGGAQRGDPTQLEKIEAEIRKELAALSVSWVPAYERRSCG